MVNLHQDGRGTGIDRIANALGLRNRLRHARLLGILQSRGHPAPAGRSFGSRMRNPASWERPLGVMVILQGDRDLLHAVAALHLAACAASVIDRWKEQRDQQNNNRADNEELDKGEAVAASRIRMPPRGNTSKRMATHHLKILMIVPVRAGHRDR